VPRVFQDDLLCVSISRLRALGVITSETTTFRIQLGDVEQTVGVTERRFPRGGGWSLFVLFVCPSCGGNVRLLRLLDGAVLCARCCISRGAGCRVWPMSRRQRAEHRIQKLRAMLETPVSLRLKPVLWGTMERRGRLEAALRRAEYVVSRSSRRFRDVQAEEILPEPIARPKVKTPR
jgi:hypothetical protein